MSGFMNFLMSLGNRVIGWIHNFNLYQIVCLLVGIAVFSLAVKIASRTLRGIVRVIAIIIALYFLFPNVYWSLLNTIRSIF